VADACHEAGVKAVAVTAGYVCDEPRAEFYRHMDAANVDLKAFTEEFYRHTCGAGLEAVKDTLRYLRHETSVWFEITTLLIPGRAQAAVPLAVVPGKVTMSSHPFGLLTTWGRTGGTETWWTVP
jgi:pyruvate formate lyase activating enzyme